MTFKTPFITWPKSLNTFNIGLGLVALLILVAILAPWLAPFEPNVQHMGQRLLAPNSEYLLGTDRFGRDLLSRVLFGARPTLILVSLVVLLTVPIGLLFGIYAGYFGGWVERVLMRITDIVMSLPSLIIALALVSILGPSLMNGIHSWSKFDEWSLGVSLY